VWKKKRRDVRSLETREKTIKYNAPRAHILHLRVRCSRRAQRETRETESRRETEGGREGGREGETCRMYETSGEAAGEELEVVGKLLKHDVLTKVVFCAAFSAHRAALQKLHRSVCVCVFCIYYFPYTLARALSLTTYEYVAQFRTHTHTTHTQY
jgi:hypothetical protein